MRRQRSWNGVVMGDGNTPQQTTSWPAGCPWKDSVKAAVENGGTLNAVEYDNTYSQTERSGQASQTGIHPTSNAVQVQVRWSNSSTGILYRPAAQHKNVYCVKVPFPFLSSSQWSTSTKTSHQWQRPAYRLECFVKKARQSWKYRRCFTKVQKLYLFC